MTNYSVKQKHIYKYAYFILSSATYYKIGLYPTCFFFLYFSNTRLRMAYQFLPINCVFKDLPGIIRLSSCCVYHFSCFLSLPLIWLLILLNKCLLLFCKCTLISARSKSLFFFFSLNLFVLLSYLFLFFIFYQQPKPLEDLLPHRNVTAFSERYCTMLKNGFVW